VDILYTRCAGLDVHKKTVVACLLTQDAQGKAVRHTRTFGTMTADILDLLDWLQAHDCVHVAMESTGEYWKPIYNLLEGRCDLLVANARHIKSVPGRKTDIKDAAWIADLHQHGLLRPSFIPPAPQRALRDLTRYRSSFVRERATTCNRVQKLLEDANIKLASVATDVLGVSCRAMLDAMIAGNTNAGALALLAQGRLQEKRDDLERALQGRFAAHHRIILTELLCQIDSLDASIARLSKEIETACVPFDEAVAHLDTIPGVARTTAEVILSEIGADMSRFPTPGHLAAWAGVAPGNCQSGGKRLSNRTRQGNKTLKCALVQAAQAASRTRGTYLSAQFARLSARRGRKKAIVAVAHSILVIAYRLLERREDYKDLGGDYFDRRQPQVTTNRLVGRLQQLGYEVTLCPLTPAEAA